MTAEKTTPTRSHRLTWEVKKRSDGALVLFTGQINELADLTPLTSLSGKIVFDLAGVHLNSEGVRRWTSFIRQLDKVEELSYVRCSPAMVVQLNLVRGVRGNATVVSFYAPYICDETGDTDDRLLMVDSIKDPLSPPVFVEDGREFHLDEVPERYLAFIVDRDHMG